MNADKLATRDLRTCQCVDGCTALKYGETEVPEDKSEFIRLAMQLLQLKNITETNEIKAHMKSVFKEQRDFTSKSVKNWMFHLSETLGENTAYITK